MKSILEYINGNKTLISSVLMTIVNSDLVEKLIQNPDLYILMQSISGAMFLGGLGHKVKKVVTPTPTTTVK